MCAVLSSDDRKHLSQSGTELHVRRGETVFAAGSEHVACATLLCGALKVVDLDGDGNETILSIIHPAGFAGELFAPSNRHSVVALTDSRLCVFPQQAFDQALREFPALAHAMLERTASELNGARDHLALTSRKSAMARVAALLLALARSASASACRPAAWFELPLSRSEMAGMAGLTIETVSRKLGLLEKQGLIRRDGRRAIALIDPAALETLAG